MDMLENLNPEQRLAVEHGEGPALVLAGAGSGKTRVIVHRIAYLILRGASRPENILAVTFTNKAAQEMRERIHRLLGPSRSAEPLISTFHAFCVRLLRREIHFLGYRQDFSIYDTDDQKRLMKQILEDSHREELSAREVLSRVSYAKNHNVTPEVYAHRFPSETAEEIAALYRTYDSRLRKANALDFDDLLLKTVELFTRYAARRDHYSNWFRYILVDEYQDTNRPQYELLRLLTARHRNVFVVGDEDQSIYKFRGADIRNILSFEKDFPGTRTIKLEQNYRSTQNILRVAGAVVEHNTARKGKTLWTENHAGDVITCHRASSARSEACWVVRRIQGSQLENPDWRAAVLYRANFLSRNFEDVLREEGIPYTVVGSVGFFSRMEVKDMLAYLRVIHNPEDDVALLRIVNTPPRGIGSSTVEALTRKALDEGIPISQALQAVACHPLTPARASRSLRRFHEMLDAWMALRDTATIAGLLERIVRDTEYQAMLEKQESLEEAENRMANIEELIRAAAESQAREETVFEFLDRASLSSELDQIDTNARVVLMTLHSAKGLEFDLVFLAGLEEGLFPHAQSLNSNEDLEEERRLCYVGITRARQKLFLSWTPFRRSYGADAGMPAFPSRFLDEMPGDLVEGLGETGPTYVRDEEEDYDRGQEDMETPFRQSRRSVIRRPSRQDAAAAEPAASRTAFRSGMRVRHAQFGDGIIMNRVRIGNDFKLTITFSRVGKKTLIERFAKLQAL